MKLGRAALGIRRIAAFGLFFTLSVSLVAWRRRPLETPPPGHADGFESSAGVPTPRTASLAASLSDDDRALLRRTFGIDDPSRLYLSDSTRRAVLLYRAVPEGCADRAGAESVGPARCRPVAVRVGLTAARRTNETWDAFITRVRRSGPSAWANARNEYFTGLASLDPGARPAFERLLADARRSGFHVHVEETYRTPERQAFLLARGDGRTATATSVHSYGRAVDIVLGDGRVQRPATARAWISFRRWLVRYRGGSFHVVGTPERTWDWPHVELAAPPLGFRSVTALLAAARRCGNKKGGANVPATMPCTLTPHLPTPRGRDSRTARYSTVTDLARLRG